MMKNLFLRMLKGLLYPLVWCHRVIWNAPMLDCDNALMDYSDWMCGREKLPLDQRGMLMHAHR